MEEIKESLKRYVEYKIPTGGFLQSVLENNLFEAIARADDINRYRIHKICKYIYNKLPSNCWGSKSIVEEWLQNNKSI